MAGTAVALARARGHNPPRLRAFQTSVLERCEQFRPTHVLATGIAPLGQTTLAEMRARRICTLNFLTDDPWNPSQRCGLVFAGSAAV